MNIVTLTPGRIGVMEVDENHRAVVLKRHFDRRDLKIESDIYALMRRIAPDYRHSDWRVFETEVVDVGALHRLAHALAGAGCLRGKRQHER